MAVYEFEGNKPIIDKKAYVHELASVIGNVIIGERCFIAPFASIRGDYGTIYICDNTSIQDNVSIHALDGGYTYIGRYVQIAHGSCLHNCYIDDFAIVGINSTINDYAKIGKWSVVAPGAVVPARRTVSDETVVAGEPAKFLREIRDNDKEYWMKYKNEYPDLAFPRYPKGLRRIYGR